jgi:pimeloyl-ACP methyl ester carboxylesterase
MQSDLITCNGLKIHYLYNLTEPNADTLIFLHNGGIDAHLWDAQFKTFQKYNIYAPDMPGYGHSAKPTTPHTLQMYCDVLTDFIDQLAIKNPILIGNCIGSGTALGYSLQNPDKVKKLFITHLLTERILSQSSVMSWPYKWSKNSVLDKILSFFSNISNNTKSLYNLSQNLASFAALNFVERPDNFPPTWIVWTKDNPVLDYSAGKRFNDNFFKADRFITIPKGKHLLMKDRPEVYNNILSQFLDF